MRGKYSYFHLTRADNPSNFARLYAFVCSNRVRHVCFCGTSCIAFWDTHFVEETLKMAYFERVTRPRIKHSQRASNHDKQWHRGIFVSGDNAHKSLRTYVARVRGSYRVFTWVFGFLGETDSIETVLLSFIGCIFSCSMDLEREVKSSVKSSAFSRVYSTQEVWFFVFSYDQIRRRDDILAGS